MQGDKKKDVLLAFNSPLIFLILFTQDCFNSGKRFGDVVNTNVPLKKKFERDLYFALLFSVQSCFCRFTNSGLRALEKNLHQTTLDDFKFF